MERNPFILTYSVLSVKIICTDSFCFLQNGKLPALTNSDVSRGSRWDGTGTDSDNTGALACLPPQHVKSCAVCPGPQLQPKLCRQRYVLDVRWAVGSTEGARVRQEPPKFPTGLPNTGDSRDQAGSFTLTGCRVCELRRNHQSTAG